MDLWKQCGLRKRIPSLRCHVENLVFLGETFRRTRYRNALYGNPANVSFTTLVRFGGGIGFSIMDTLVIIFFQSFIFVAESMFYRFANHLFQYLWFYVFLWPFNQSNREFFMLRLFLNPKFIFLRMFFSTLVSNLTAFLWQNVWLLCITSSFYYYSTNN